MINLRNKKGMEIGGKIVVLVIALMVLGIMIYAGYYFFTGQAIPFFNMFPSLKGSGDGAVKATEIFRYNLQSGEVQYYDGTVWNKLKGSIIVNDKSVSDSKIRGEIEGVYYNRIIPNEPIWKSEYRTVKIIFSGGEGDLGYNPRVYDEARIVSFDWENYFVADKIYKQSVLKIKVTEITEKVYSSRVDKTEANVRNYYIDSQDKVYSQDAEGKIYEMTQVTDSELRQIVTKAFEWRNSALKVPIQISWLPANPETGSGDWNNYCISKLIDKERYFWVDLAKPTSEATCSGV